MEPETIIRPYDAVRDSEGLRECIIEQQDVHHRLEPIWPEGQAIVGDYMKYLEIQCAAHDGRLIVAECRGEVVGFICVLASVDGDSPDDPATFAWIQDVFVKPAYQRQGLATRLMSEAESFSRTRHAQLLRLGVLERNEDARSFYRKLGFRDYFCVLTKSLE